MTILARATNWKVRICLRAMCTRTERVCNYIDAYGLRCTFCEILVFCLVCQLFFCGLNFEMIEKKITSLDKNHESRLWQNETV